MICFLTSSPFEDSTGALNPANGFTKALVEVIPARAKGLFISSDTDSFARTDGFAQSVWKSFCDVGISLAECRVLDNRNRDHAAELTAWADLIVLAGGHVPTQNRFFQQIGLRERMHRFRGVVVGISAGTMNSADVVYAHPELEGEAVDPQFQRFLPGLGLTKIQILPHYQMIKDDVLDGLRVFEEIAYPDSVGRAFYALVDGSYLFLSQGVQELRGEAYRIRDGILRQVCSRGEVLSLSDEDS